MSIRKRILALAAVGVFAVLLGGALNITHRATSVSAASATQLAVGCVNSTNNDPTQVMFPYTVATGFGAQTATAPPLAATTVAPGTLNVLAPTGVMSCDVLAADGSTPGSTNCVENANPAAPIIIHAGACTATEAAGPAVNVVGPPATCNTAPPAVGGTGTLIHAGVCTLPETTAPGGTPVSITTATGDTDANPATVDGGTFTYLLNAGVNNFIQILETNGVSASVQCGNANVPVAPAGNESCQGMTPAGAGLFAGVASNGIHIGFRPGATFPVIGSATPNITLSVSYNRFAALGAGTAGPASVNISTVLPVYAIVFGVNPATIPAATQAQGGTGSVITVNMWHVTTTQTACGPLLGSSTFLICGAPANVAGLTTPGLFGFVQGSESGVITLTTSLGVWGATSASPQASAGQSATQIVSIHCGSLPGVTPLILLPNIGLNPLGGGPIGFGFNTCLNVSATLFGGGSAGQATVIASFVGDFTGVTAQNATTVNMAPGALTVNLTTGCNEVITPASMAANTTTAQAAALAVNFTVASIWRFDNASHVFKAGFFSVAAAPTDFGTVQPNQSIFICGTGTGTYPQ